MQSTLIATASGHKIAHLTLNNPKLLNAQNLEMVRTMRVLFDAWAADDDVVMVLLTGSGERAFCAGGDIKSLHAHGIDEQDLASADKDGLLAEKIQLAKEFFIHEYGTMYAMHTYPKPIVAWGNGVVMGGGLGLLAASSHKVVTNSTLMAMPEVSIGLFPDAGGSYFLNHMLGKVGLFLGLTGARFTGADALHLGLADAFCAHDDFDALLATLCQADWQATKNDAHALVSKVLQQYHRAYPPSQVLSALDEINRLMNAGDLLAVDSALQNYTGDDAWIKAAIDSYRQGSATTKALTWRIFHALRTTKKGVALSEIFKMEECVATQCVVRGDFKEGVRALLIDKDKNPKWRYTLQNLPDEYLAQFFENGW
ncbi:hypothetical protein B0181_07595 [Moraxella caviae]|uniref:3-hydroxyisobutyryl-CoA hydrolase n=1 Tax=Moraxella caviae TaxID=34060 RepID=A0A1T0A0Z0_9GAMM|nr:hypothetical protein B0181_07595 [Moraxella caviae]